MPRAAREREIDDAIIPERELLARFPWIGASRLRRLVKSGKVSYLAGRQGSRHYAPEHIAALLKVIECRAPETPSSNSPANGSPASRGGLDIGVSGMTPELRESAVLRLAARI